MQYFFAASSLGFYRADVHKTMPVDAKPISEDLYLSLLGKQIEADEHGMPCEVAVLPASLVPESVTMRQARLALLGAGKLALVDLAIAGLPSPQKEAALIEWEFAATADRRSPLLLMMADALGMTDEELDKLFMLASSL